MQFLQINKNYFILSTTFILNDNFLTWLEI